MDCGTRLSGKSIVLSEHLGAAFEQYGIDVVIKNISGHHDPTALIGGDGIRRTRAAAAEEIREYIAFDAGICIVQIDTVIFAAEKDVVIYLDDRPRQATIGKVDDVLVAARTTKRISLNDEILVPGKAMPIDGFLAELIGKDRVSNDQVRMTYLKDILVGRCPRHVVDNKPRVIDLDRPGPAVPVFHIHVGQVIIFHGFV